MWSGAEVRARLLALPVFVLVIPWRCSLVAPQRDTGPVGPSAVSPKQEEPIGRIQAVPPPPQTASAITLPEEVVVKAMDAGQQAFLRCWARAQRIEVGPITDKVRLHLEIDDQGRVTDVRSDSDSLALSRCLGVVARRLPFPPPGQPAVVDLPLMFR